MTIIHELASCDGALVEMTIGGTTIYSFNREQWYTDLVEVLLMARQYWGLRKQIRLESHDIPDLYLAKIDKRLGELLPPKGLFDIEEQTPDQ